MTSGDGREDHRILVVTTTVGSAAAAAELARSMVERRLAACVQIDPEVTSFYRWDGGMCEDREARLVIKTAPGLEAAVRSFLAEHHPYELPQFVAMTVSASPEYAQWVLAEVTPAEPAGPASGSGRGS